MQGTDDPRTVFVIPLGTNGFVSTGQSGSFSLSNMAEGQYSVRFLSILDRYLPLDTTFTVMAGQALTLPDFIRLPLKIPTPTGFKITYDTLKQFVTLSWNKMDSARVKGYNVYRQQVDSAEVKLNMQVKTDTFYVDSTGIQDLTYIYNVVGVDFENKEGIKTAGDVIRLVGILIVSDSIVNGQGSANGQFGWNARGAIDLIGNFYIIDNLNNWLQKLDSNGMFEFKIDTFNQPSGITYASNQYSYITDFNAKQLVKIDTIGNVQKIISTKGRPGAVLFNSDSLFVASDSGIEVYVDDSLRIVWSFTFDLSYSHMDLGLSPNGDLYIVDSRNIYRVNKQTAGFSSVYQIQNTNRNQDARIQFISSDTLFLLTTNAVAPYNSTIYLLHTTAGILSNWKTSEAIDDIFINNSHELIALSSEGKILKLHRNF
jgi:hypothetical protein